MKSSVMFVCFLQIFFAVPALAMEASSCAARSAHLRLSERNAYMKSCLAQVSSPANVKEAELRRKRALCEQNAKNFKLQGNDRANYIATCMNRNEAEAAAKHNQTIASKKAAKPAPARAAAEVNPKVRSKPNAKVARNGKRETTN